MSERMSSVKGQRRLRRQLGINWTSCFQKYCELKEDGDVDMTDAEAIAVAIETELIVLKLDDPSIDWGSIDWEKLFEFIMKIVELFIKFL